MISSDILTSIRLSFAMRNVEMYDVSTYSHLDLTTFRDAKQGHV